MKISINFRTNICRNNPIKKRLRNILKISKYKRYSLLAITNTLLKIKLFYNNFIINLGNFVELKI